MQASGRAGRGEKPGEMIIQTYNPDQYCIEAVKKQDPEIFYNNEMAFRRMAGYPPYTSMFLVLVTAPDQKTGRDMHPVSERTGAEKGNPLCGAVRSGA